MPNYKALYMSYLPFGVLTIRTERSTTQGVHFSLKVFIHEKRTRYSIFLRLDYQFFKPWETLQPFPLKNSDSNINLKSSRNWWIFGWLIIVHAYRTYIGLQRRCLNQQMELFFVAVSSFYHPGFTTLSKIPCLRGCAFLILLFRFLSVL